MPDEGSLLISENRVNENSSRAPPLDKVENDRSRGGKVELEKCFSLDRAKENMKYLNRIGYAEGLPFAARIFLSRNSLNQEEVENE